MDSQKDIKLNEPTLKGGSTIQEALANRRCYRGGIGSKNITKQELSDLLWAANGVNRSGGMRTAPSAMDARDVDVYALTEQGAYRYDPDQNVLVWITDGDYRKAAGGGQDFVTTVPVVIILVADYTRYDAVHQKSGIDLTPYMVSLAAMDAGIVSQNINLYCSGNGLATISRGTMDQKVLREVLVLSESQQLLLNNAVGYPQP